MANATTYREPRERAGLVDWLSMGTGIILAAIIVLSALATAQQNNTNQINYQATAAAE